jgi:hypothetical protein
MPRLSQSNHRHVIANAVKQSSSRQINDLDCFTTFAMTDTEVIADADEINVIFLCLNYLSNAEGLSLSIFLFHREKSF